MTNKQPIERSGPSRRRPLRTISFIQVNNNSPMWSRNFSPGRTFFHPNHAFLLRFFALCLNKPPNSNIFFTELLIDFLLPIRNSHSPDDILTVFMEDLIQLFHAVRILHDDTHNCHSGCHRIPPGCLIYNNSIKEKIVCPAKYPALYA